MTEFNDSGLLVLGDQLFPLNFLPPLEDLPVFMAEDWGLCRHYRYHKHKIILSLSAMRSYADSLREAGARLQYRTLVAESDTCYEDVLVDWIRHCKLKKVFCFEIEDKFFETRIQQCLEKIGAELVIMRSPMFLVERKEFARYLTTVKKPMMKSFYERLRKKHMIMMTPDGKPVGGKYSFDAENRKKLPKKNTPPEVGSSPKTNHVADVSTLTDKLFADHAGDATAFWLPTTRKEALKWLQKFLKYRFKDFGPYEDAITQRSDIVYHSVLSPLMNIGLLTPQEIMEKAVKYADKHDVVFNSLEGFLRQIIGWREFVRGIYRNHSESQESTNFWNHSRRLADCWYEGTTGIPPVDDSIEKANRLGYNHHIERLMILSSSMLMCEIDPKEVYRWFMEMFVDASEWVMGPNVYGMGQYSDGGIFATKPYICSSNYILKMSDYEKGDWCDIMDGLYWRFIEKHITFYSRNPRMGVMVVSLKKLDPKRKERIYTAAEAFIERVTFA